MPNPLFVATGKKEDLSADHWRHEHKYRIAQLSAALVHQQLMFHPLGFHTQFPSRWVHSIYFDTPDRDCFFSNVEGVGHRMKYRLRWYDRLEPGNFPFRKEVKKRRSQLGIKRIDLHPAFSMNQWEQQVADIKKWFEPNLVLDPVLVVSYYRHYYAIAGGKYRITIDEKIQYRPFSLQFSKLQAIQEDALILEFKYDANLEPHAELIRQWLSFRQTKNSKYVEGMRRIYF